MRHLAQAAPEAGLAGLVRHSAVAVLITGNLVVTVAGQGAVTVTVALRVVQAAVKRIQLAFMLAKLVEGSECRSWVGAWVSCR